MTKLEQMQEKIQELFVWTDFCGDIAGHVLVKKDGPYATEQSEREIINSLITEVWNEAVEATKIKNKETIEYYQLRARNEAIKEEREGILTELKKHRCRVDVSNDECEDYIVLWEAVLQTLLPRTNITSNK